MLCLAVEQFIGQGEPEWKTVSYGEACHFFQNTLFFPFLPVT